MNTVDALKKLYKTMTGNDWPYDPNPTDAEVIDKIAADGSTGGGGSGGGGRALYVNRVLEAAIPFPDGPAAVDWDSPNAYFIGKGLSAEDIALMTPCYEFTDEDGETVDTHGGGSDLAEIGAFRGISASEGAIEGVVHISIYGDGGNNGSILPAMYNSATGTIIGIAPDDPDDPLG